MTKRLRIFAGPNGSGKSTIIEIVRNQGINLGVYVNADEIKLTLDNKGLIDFAHYNLEIDSVDFFHELQLTTIINGDQRELIKHQVEIRDNYLIIGLPAYNDIFSTFLADYIRLKLIKSCDKFSFETVMSHESKLKFIEQAKQCGYKVYLYFVSLEDPIMNIQRVEARVLQGGHGVDPEKISNRYLRTMNFLLKAIKLVDKAFLFDNSTDRPLLFATYKEDEITITEIEKIPVWFFTYVLNKITPNEYEF